MTFELLIVNHDVLSLLALKLGLLQTVLQCPKVLQSNTTLFTKSAKSGIFCHTASIKKGLSPNYHGFFLSFSSTGINRLCSTTGLGLHSLIFQLQLFKAALLGLSGVF